MNFRVDSSSDEENEPDNKRHRQGESPAPN